MINNQLILDVHDELIIDNFAGGGGASTGIMLALGRHVDHAINHERLALGMHRINHPQTVHHHEDVFDIDPATICEGRPVGLAHFSPDCKHFSRAKGGKPLDRRIRGLVLVMLRWAKYGARVMTMENVVEIQTWGPLVRKFKHGRWDWYPDSRYIGRTWRAFLDCLGTGIGPTHPDLPDILAVLDGTVTREECVKGFGYAFEAKELRACDLGAPTIRKRLFMVARRDGRPIVFPKTTHFEPSSTPTRSQAWRTIAECIDWTLPCPSIFLNRQEAKRARCKRPLVKATLKRIATGIDKYVLKAKDPFLVSLTHQGGDRVESIRQPARTITGAHRGEKAIVCPVLTEHANSSNQRMMPANAPLRTQCAQVKGGHFSLVAGNMLKLRGDNIGDAVDQPVHTVSAGGTHHGLVATSLIRHFGMSVGQRLDSPAPTVMGNGGGKSGLIATHLTKFCTGSVGTDMCQPAPTVTAGSHSPNTHGGAAGPLGIVAASIASTGSLGAEGADSVASLNDPTADALETMTDEEISGARRVAAFLRAYGVKFEGEFAMIEGFVIVDIGLRMLVPRELFRAQGFPDSYVIDRAWVVDPQNGRIEEVQLTKEQQIRMCGNSVCPPVQMALIRANVPELSILGRPHRRNLPRELAGIG